MKYLIPAWYHKDEWWRDKAMPFYETHFTTEFDDMVSLGNMLAKHAEPFELICLNYHSELRNFYIATVSLNLPIGQCLMLYKGSNQRRRNR